MSALTVRPASAQTAACRQHSTQRHRPATAAQAAIRRQASQLSAQQHRCIGGQLLLSGSAPASGSRSGCFRCRADGDESERLPDGTRVRVTQALKVFHAPKRKEGLDLEGMEGELQGYVDIYKGKKLSSNLPAKIKFLIDNDGKESKFFTHLVSAAAAAVHPSSLHPVVAMIHLV